MRHTKTDLARVIVTALYNRPELVRADHPEVIRRARRGTVESLTRQHKLAMAAIESEQQKATQEAHVP